MKDYYCLKALISGQKELIHFFKIYAQENFG